MLANDADPDLGPLTATLVSGPANGTPHLNPDGSFTYTPARLNPVGGDGSSCTVTDAFGGTATGTVVESRGTATLPNP